MTDLTPVMLSDVIAKECSKKTYMAYARGLNHSYQQDLTINCAFTKGVQGIKNWLGNLPTVGLVAVSEIMYAIETYDSMSESDAREYFAGGADIYGQDSQSADAEIIQNNTQKRKINKNITNIGPTETDKSSPKSFFQFCSHSLTGSQGKVIRLRFREDGVSTLEQVGISLGLTRERVRQIERQAFQTISEYLSDAVSTVYDRHKEELAKKVFGQRLLIPTASFLSEFKKLNIYDIFLITARFGNAKEWARVEFEEEKESYLRDRKSFKNAVAHSEKINVALKAYQLPVPVEIIAKICALSIHDVLMALMMEQKFTIHNNYVIEKRTVTARVRRAINAHLLLTKFSRLNVLKGILLPDLATLYRVNFCDDRCSSRDLDIVFVQNPHLFLKLYEYGWVSINPELTIQKEFLQSRHGLSVDLDAARFKEHELSTLPVDALKANLIRDEDQDSQHSEIIKYLIKLGNIQGYLELQDLSLIYKDNVNSFDLKTLVDMFKNIGIHICYENSGSKVASRQTAIGLENTQDVTIVSSLQKILTNGAMRFEDIRKKLVTDSNNTYALASTGPVLINNQDIFTRYAPSIYGLRESEKDIAYLSSARNLLLVTDQCETYCLAAMAGVGVGSYLLWDYQMEYQWTTWLSKTGQPELLSSLLFVATPSEWKCDDWEKRKWSERKTQLEYFGLKEKNRFTILETEVSIYQVVAAATASMIAGFTSWALINRAIGARLDDRHSQSLLALLIYIGIARPGDHWQEVHCLADGAKAKSLELLEDYSRYLLTNESDLLRQALSKHSPNASNLGWVDKNEIYELHSKLLGSITSDNSAKDHQSNMTTSDQSSIDTNIKSVLLKTKIESSWKI
jgi:hypothetical protein